MHSIMYNYLFQFPAVVLHIRGPMKQPNSWIVNQWKVITAQLYHSFVNKPLGFAVLDRQIRKDVSIL